MLGRECCACCGLRKAIQRLNFCFVGLYWSNSTYRLHWTAILYSAGSLMALKL
jgi:hypothetical protein